jgi:hypothetical protein
LSASLQCSIGYITSILTVQEIMLSSPRWIPPTQSWEGWITTERAHWYRYHLVWAQKTVDSMLDRRIAQFPNTAPWEHTISCITWYNDCSACVYMI